MDVVLDERPLWQQDLDEKAVGHKIYAVAPYVGGVIDSIEEHYCPFCKKTHLMYKTTMQCGFPLEMFICPTNVINTGDGEYLWTRVAMSENDEEAPFFGCPDKVSLGTRDNSELDKVLEKIDTYRAILLSEEYLDQQSKTILDKLRYSRFFRNKYKSRLER